MSIRRPLGPGRPLPDAALRDPRTRTAAERAADGEWLLDDGAEPGPGRRRAGRRVLGTGISGQDRPEDAPTAGGRSRE
ncbi:hypothetical protein [Streptomyces pactum]|uniref:hypothetical protein n=1 Tax=Streptomyces pactum TaxID=68249 RepID=UPI0036F7AC0A